MAFDFDTGTLGHAYGLLFDFPCCILGHLLWTFMCVVAGRAFPLDIFMRHATGMYGNKGALI